MELFANRLKNLIAESGHTQKTFAEKYKFGKNQVNFWCNNKSEPDLKTVVLLCSIFSVSSDYLLGITDY